MFRFLKELYLTGFLLGFKFAKDRWPFPVNIGKGVAGVTLIEAFILLGIQSWIEIHRGTRFHDNDWKSWIAFLALSLPNYYALVTLGHGIKFEREFAHLKKSKKILLLVSFTALMLATILFTIYSVSAYQHFFHIIPKSDF